MKKAIPSEGEKNLNIGWLTGIFDGEGSAVFYKTIQRDRRRGNNIVRYGWLTRLVIINTDEDLIRKSLEILSNLDILAYINQKCASKKQREGSFRFTKPCFEIIVSQRKSVEKFARVLYPNLISYKKEKIKAILDYFDTHPFNAGRKSPRVTTERLAPDSNLKRFESLRMKLQSAL